MPDACSMRTSRDGAYSASQGQSLRCCPTCNRLVGPRHWYASGKSRCTNRLFWTRARLWRLMELLERGDDDEAIARDFGVTAEAVKIVRLRRGIPSRRRQLLCASDVARMMGWSCAKKVTRLIERGYLRGRRGQRCGANHDWIVREEDLLRFLANPACWQMWDPARIVDLALHEHAEEIRGGVRYLTLRELARRHCVEPAAVADWIARGILPAVRAGGETGNHLVRERDADAFRRPEEVRREEVAAAIGTLRRRGLTQRSIADLLGIERDHVGDWQRGKRHPLQRTAAQFQILLRETAHLPEDETLAAGRCAPVPGFEDIVARVRPLVEAVPLGYRRGTATMSEMTTEDLARRLLAHAEWMVESGQFRGTALEYLRFLPPYPARDEAIRILEERERTP